LTEESVPLSFFKDLTMGDPLALKDGTLFGVAGFNQIYVMEKGKEKAYRSIL